MSTGKRRAAVQQPRPAPGQGAMGALFDPAATDPAPAGDDAPDPSRPRAMPAPQGPLPADEIERLKSRAAKPAGAVPGPGQSDPAAEPRRK